MEQKETRLGEILISNQEKWHDYYFLCDLDETYMAMNDPLMYRVHRAGLDPQLPDVFRVERKAGSEYGIITFIFRGRGSVTYEDQVYPLTKGDLFVLPPGIPHAYDSDTKSPMGQIWIEIDGGDCERIMKAAVSVLGPVLNDRISNRIGSRMTQLIQKLTIGSYLDIPLIVYQILSDLIYEKNSVAQEDKSEVTARVHMAKSYMDAHIAEVITNERLAEISGLSKSYFMKSFKNIFSRTPQEYMMYQKLESARHYLIHSNISVDQLAEKLGFCSTSHFIKRYKKHIGVTPAVYRRQAKQISV